MSHNPKRKLQNYDEDEDEIEEDDEHDEIRDKFFDYEAEEDDEEESEENQMTEKERKELEEQRKRFDKKNELRENYSKRLENEQEYIKDLEDREEYEEQFENQDTQYQEIDAVLPEKPDDTFGVYMVKCKQGKERDIAMRIMKLWITNKDRPMHMFSVFVPEEKKGTIFVEVMDKQKFVDAVDGVRDIYVNSITELTQQQMKDLFIARLPTVIEQNSYVLIDHGVYKGDVGIVLHQLDPRRVLVKLVPRFDIDSYILSAEIKRLSKSKDSKKQYDEEDEDDDERVKQLKKKKSRMTQVKTRQVFEPHSLGILDVVDCEPDDPNHMVIYKFNNQTFHDGFIHKVYRINQLKFNDIKPSTEDIKLFSGGDELYTKARMRYSRKLQIKKGDKVIITATNEKVNKKRSFIEMINKPIGNGVEDQEEDKCTYVLYGFELDEPLLLHREDFELYYEVNDRVKIIDGTYVGETGTIEKVNDDNTIIFRRDYTDTILTIDVMDIELTYEVNSKKQQLGEYKVNDYVTLNEGVGLILDIQFDTNLFEILNDQNKKIVVDQSQIQGIIRERKDARSKDRNKQVIMKGEIIKIANGMYAGREAEILHIHDITKIFVRIPGILENNGFVVVLNSMIQKKISSTRGNATEHFAKKEREMKREMKRENEFESPKGARSLDEFKPGTLVTLTKKGFKNYTGKITKRIGDKYEIHVNSTNKKMRFERNEFVLYGSLKQEMKDDNPMHQTPMKRNPDYLGGFDTPKTPMTPMTPMPGNRLGDYMSTPMKSSYPQTPSGQYHMNYPPQTPAMNYNSQFTPKTPSNQGFGHYPPPTPSTK